VAPYTGSLKVWGLKLAVIGAKKGILKILERVLIQGKKWKRHQKGTFRKGAES